MVSPTPMYFANRCSPPDSLAHRAILAPQGEAGALDPHSRGPSSQGKAEGEVGSREVLPPRVAQASAAHPGVRAKGFAEDPRRPACTL